MDKVARDIVVGDVPVARPADQAMRLLNNRLQAVEKVWPGLLLY